MKTILYVTLVHDLESNLDGVTRKVKSQIGAFSKHHFEVIYTFRQNQKIWLDTTNRRFELGAVKKNSLVDQRTIYKKLMKMIDNNEIQFDLVYIRHFIADATLVEFLKKIRDLNIKSVLEIPTYPYIGERTKVKHFAMNIYDKYYQKKLKNTLDYIATFSDHETIWNVKCININNGYDPKYKLLNFSKRRNDAIIFTSVSTCSKWHGIDRFLFSLEKYYTENIYKTEIDFNIIGDGETIEELKGIVNASQHLKKHVKFYGMLSMKETMAIYEQTHIGVGSLAIHRIGIESAQPLKNREYGICGLPFVIAFNDPGFTNQSFAYRVEGNEDAFALQDILDWYQNLSITSSEISLNCKKFSWDNQILKILEYVNISSNG